MFCIQAANPGCLLEDFVRWYSPRDWIEEEEEDNCPPSDSAAVTTNSSPPQQRSRPEELKNDSTTGAERETEHEGSPQGTCSVGRGDAEMEVGEAATVRGDTGETGDAGDVGEGGDGWDNEDWGEDDWDMINDDGEVKSRQEDSPSQDNSVPEPPAIKVKKMCISCFSPTFQAKVSLCSCILKILVCSRTPEPTNASAKQCMGGVLELGHAHPSLQAEETI